MPNAPEKPMLADRAAASTNENPLRGRRVAVLATDGVEQVELVQPMEALRAAGAEVHLVSLACESIQAMNHDDKADTFPVDRSVDEVKIADYQGLVIPGGVANPDRLRADPAAVKLVRDFVEHDKPVASICHGPWLLVEANVVRGRTLTSWPSLQTDIRNAGGEWVDREVVVDQKLVTSRKPADLPAFCEKLVSLMSSAVEESLVDRAIEQTFPASDPTSFQVPASAGAMNERRSRPRDEAAPPA
ncbi:intracellular protease, PfpI family [Gemmatirosa kalamazoonensis]|uniref:Intracellular protease, PfpI family n=1 Tax=Gemmatirosa kalamazoonensis TaxID=861299 RepID=W0RKP9_9BACT|nr:type 1 glutamine amidotransferase domain-containing protein [Gemmatirosa kalamazoonensis]AHG91331.1 intracellular protease, PfpI family [Gemmatirosa kalamazoonensis]